MIALVRSCYPTRDGDYRVTVLYSKRDGGKIEVLRAAKPFDEGQNVRVADGQIVGAA